MSTARLATLLLASSLLGCQVPEAAAAPPVKVAIVVPPGTFSPRATVTVSIERPGARAETFTIPAARLTSPLRLTSHRLRPGKRYRISIGGLAGDDCNQTGASAEGVLRGARLTVEPRAFGTTTMACPSAPPPAP